MIIIAGQSNQEAHGTDRATFPGFTGLPGGAGASGINASANCYETPATLPGATAGSGTLVCASPTSGVLYAGQIVTAPGAPAGQVIAAGNNMGNFPSASGMGGAGSYVVTPAATIGSAGAPVAMTFAEGDIGGGAINPRCQIWSPTAGGGGSWHAYDPDVNSDPQGAGAQSAAFGPEGEFCRRWTVDHPGETLYMVKIAIGGAHLCDVAPNGNDFSPEYAGTGLQAATYTLLRNSVASAEKALVEQGQSYTIDAILWGQGEQDKADACGLPAAPFAASTGPAIYGLNLRDLIGRMAVPSDANASFVGAISQTTLTVSRVKSGALRQYQRVSAPGVLPQTYIAGQLTGKAGGPGTYALQVYQAVGKGVITSSSGARCDRAAINGTIFSALPDAYAGSVITRSCVSGGAFAVGNTLSGAGVVPGTVITGLDTAGHTADGWYSVNVIQNAASETMSAALPGWGVGADTARFIMFDTASAVYSGVNLSKHDLNDHGGAALPVVTVNTNDRLQATPGQIHYHGAWIAELGRRLYLAYLGKCDYHAPTC